MRAAGAAHPRSRQPPGHAARTHGAREFTFGYPALMGLYSRHLLVAFFKESPFLVELASNWEDALDRARRTSNVPELVRHGVAAGHA